MAGAAEARHDRDAEAPGVEAPVAGAVRLVDQEVDKASRTGKARIALADVSHARIGAFASGEVDLVSRDGVGAPTTAVKRDGDEGVALCVKDGKVEAARSSSASSRATRSKSCRASRRAKRWWRARPRSCGRATRCGRCRELAGAGG